MIVNEYFTHNELISSLTFGFFFSASHIHNVLLIITQRAEILSQYEPHLFSVCLYPDFKVLLFSSLLFRLHFT